MPWNSPGNNRNDKDQGPPDLDEMLQKLSRKFGGIFGGGKGGQGSSGPGGSTSWSVAVLVIAIAAIVWMFSGFLMRHVLELLFAKFDELGSINYRSRLALAFSRSDRGTTHR